MVYDFATSRAGRHAEAFLGHAEGADDAWRGTLICDDYAGYKALLTRRLTEAGCMAHARRKFHEIWIHHRSLIGEQALGHIAALYAIEAEVREFDGEARWRLRQQRAKPLAAAFHAWLVAQRLRVPDGSATAQAIDYSLKRWAALTHYLDDGAVPIDNNRVENTTRPIAIGRNNWSFAGSERAGRRAAAIMSLIQSARMNRIDPFAYLKDVLERLPTQPARRIDELLPHRWQPTSPRGARLRRPVAAT